MSILVDIAINRYTITNSALPDISSTFKQEDSPHSLKDTADYCRAQAILKFG
ncbi:MAG: hypothetical protein IGNPGNKH_00432 [Sodalis sp. Ffu]|nr:MAG: hypothetical protein IGNPGNKH_00432 [Sodalis sp. Ffu]